jgi:hypothetical protein
MSAADIRLTCQPNKVGNTLVFPYRVANHGPADVYLMDAMPSVDPATGGAHADDQAVVVVLGPAEDAIVGKFIAPLPTDRRIAVRTLPLARRLPAGQAFEGHVSIAMPLAETSPYFADLPLRKYEVIELKGVLFTIGYWVAGADGLAALPAAYAPDHFTVVTRDTAGSAMQASQRFPTQKLQLFKRGDGFPRTIGGAWQQAAPEGEPLTTGIRRLSA